MMPVPFSSMARKMPSNLNRWLQPGDQAPGGCNLKLAHEKKQDTYSYLVGGWTNPFEKC